MQKIKAILLLGALMTSGVASADLSTGLIAHYSFDDCTATDASGNGYDGAINTSQNCVAGISGTDKALTFNGIDNTISVQNSPSLNNITNQLSVATWIKFNDIHTASFGHEWQSIFNKQGYTSSYGLMLEYDSNPKLLRFYHNGASSDFTDYSWNNVKEKQWYLVVTTYDGVNAKIYINGKLVSNHAVTGSIKTNTEDFYIGKSVNSLHSYYLNADISDLSIYNRSLNNSEITELYNAGLTVKGTITSLDSHIVTCENKTTGQVVNIAKTKATTYDCEAKGLKVNTGEAISISIEGKAK